MVGLSQDLYIFLDSLDANVDLGNVGPLDDF